MIHNSDSLVMKKLLIAVITLLLVINCQLSMAENWSLETEFQERSLEFLEKFPSPKSYGSTAFEYEKNSYPRAFIDFFRGNRDKAIAFLESEDARADEHQNTLGIDLYSGFTLKNQIRKYFYFGRYLHPQYKERMREAFQLLTRQDPLTLHLSYKRKFWENSQDDCDTWVDCRNTDGFRTMRNTSVYLMAEEVKSESTTQLYKQKIKQEVENLYKFGKSEWESETYLGYELGAWLNLSDFAQDPEVRYDAKLAADYITTTGSLKYWRGGFGGPNKRDYSQSNCVWCSGAAQSLGLYFGDSPVKDNYQDPDLIHIITSSYRPPAVAVKLGRKKFNQPAELFTVKPDYFPHNTLKKYYETLYFGKTYQIGTLAQGSGGDTNGFKLMAFNSQRGVDYLVISTGNNPTKISTSSIGHEAIAQSQNLLIWLNDQPQAPFQFFLPKFAQLEILKGRILIRLEKTWLAIAPINLVFHGISNEATSQIEQRYPDDQIVTATGTGFALEVGEGESWDNFKQRILANSRVVVESLQTAIYTSSNKRLKVQHQGSQGKRILFVNSLVSLIETIKKKLNFFFRSLKLIEK